jgi:hypothetical protein
MMNDHRPGRADSGGRTAAVGAAGSDENLELDRKMEYLVEPEEVLGVLTKGSSEKAVTRNTKYDRHGEERSSSFAPFVDGELSAEEAAFVAHRAQWIDEQGAYGHVQRTRPFDARLRLE